jgi:hypothetical protein
MWGYMPVLPSPREAQRRGPHHPRPAKEKGETLTENKLKSEV